MGERQYLLLHPAASGEGAVKPTVLYIEDNEQNLYLVTFLLRSNGYGVLQAREGQEGIAMAARHQPDLILLDIQLPGMDGYSVARRLKRTSQAARAPIVALTSYALAGDREKALESGCSGYIEKPIDPDTFLAQIEKHLEGCVPGGGAT